MLDVRADYPSVLKVTGRIGKAFHLLPVGSVGLCHECQGTLAVHTTDFFFACSAHSRGLVTFTVRLHFGGNGNVLV